MSSLMRTASWVIVEKSTGRAICETFVRERPTVTDSDRFEAIPILAYLQRLNERARNESI